MKLFSPKMSASLVAFALLSACSSVSAPLDRFRVVSAEPAETATGAYLKARFASRQRQLGLAADEYVKAAKVAPIESGVVSRAFFYALASGDIKEARRHADQLLLPNVQSPPVLPEKLEGTPSVAAALEALQRRAPDETLPRITVAVDQLATGEATLAVETLEKELDTVFTKSVGRLVRVWALRDAVGAKAALAELDRDPKDHFTGFDNLHRALLLEEVGDIKEARETWKKIITPYTNELDLVLYAKFLERHGEDGEALDMYQRMVGQTGGMARAGRLGLVRLGKPIEGEGRELIKAAKADKPRSIMTGKQGAAHALVQFGWAGYQQATTERANAARAGFRNVPAALNMPLAFAQLANHLDDDLTEADYLIGLVYVDYELPEEAIAQFANTSPASTRYEYAAMSTANAYTDMKQPDRAAEKLRNFAKNDPLGVDANMYLVDLLQQNEEYDAANALSTKMIERSEKYGSAERNSVYLWRQYFQRGAGFIQADQFEAGISDLQKAVELEPDEAMVLNYLGYSWAENGQNLDEAFAMLEKALELRPDSGAIVDSIGWAHYQLGNLEEARGYIEQAVTMEPNDATITDHLGDIYWMLGRKTEAAYEWERVLDFEPDDKLRASVEDKLKNGLPDTAKPKRLQEAEADSKATSQDQ